MFHAPAGRLHVWPAADEATELVRELAARGFACLEARGTDAASTRSDATASLRARLGAALDPNGTFGTRVM